MTGTPADRGRVICGSFCTLHLTCPACRRVTSRLCDTIPVKHRDPGAAPALWYRSRPSTHLANVTVDLALYQPDIPQNTGTLLRLGACLGVRLHIIHPTGFAFTRANLKRGGLDYLDSADFTEHVSYAAFDAWRRGAGRRLVLLTTKASQSAYAARFESIDVLLLGRESAGVPESVAADADLRLRIPMRPGLRSINVAVAASLILGEAMRQTNGFEALT
jgi:tRNA (cytidine/uridine-2'-O-)-methyltransferase